ncbi:hypothetical protein CDAR_198401 [Caerostris darwini]|uniref:Uncharacterized protein n=1 Tax=Caerostris darwini TaxID=1538125 RepID=A0AAV4W5G5_9ARAC|nr:hypothetical protein CDAR_198401 [Caerostris darwini]
MIIKQVSSGKSVHKSKGAAAMPTYKPATDEIEVSGNNSFQNFLENFHSLQIIQQQLIPIILKPPNYTEHECQQSQTVCDTIVTIHENLDKQNKDYVLRIISLSSQLLYVLH